jgi:integrase
VGVDHKALLPYNERPTPDDGTPEAYRESELSSFFGALTEERDRIAFEFLLKVGTREREMTTLEFPDLDLGCEPTVTIRARKPHLNFRVKTGRGRTIPLEKSLALKLVAWRASNPSKKLVFRNHNARRDRSVESHRETLSLISSRNLATHPHPSHISELVELRDC